MDDDVDHRRQSYPAASWRLLETIHMSPSLTAYPRFHIPTLVAPPAQPPPFLASLPCHPHIHAIDSLTDVQWGWPVTVPRQKSECPVGKTHLLLWYPHCHLRCYRA